MNGFLLDTNVPSETVRPAPDSRVIAWIEAQPLESLFISVVSFGEWHKGITLLPSTKRKAELQAWLDTSVLNLFSGRILPMSQVIAQRWGFLEVQRQLAGRTLHVPDAQIAATALEHGLTLVTRNVKDFEGMGLTILNPWSA
jgi:toxin FitB